MPTSRTHWSAWYGIFAIWLGVGLFDATQTVVSMRAEGMQHNWLALWITLFLSWLPWAVATPLVVRFARRYPLLQFNHSTPWFLHLALCLAIGVVTALWIAVFEAWLNPYARIPDAGPFPQLFFVKFYSSLLATLILYVIIVAVTYALDSRARLAQQETETARLNEQLSRAQLDALRRQIEPHFLFNTLNAIAGLVREGRTDAAVDMIAGLSDLLRRALRDSHRHQIPLGEELHFIERYLDLQKARLGDRLQFALNVPPDLSTALFPGLILQPMIENAVEHGVARLLQGGRIDVSAVRTNGLVTVQVSNDGPALPPDWEKTSAGIGISNTRTRLRSLYGEEFDLTMRNRPGGVEASVSVPFRSAKS